MEEFEFEPQATSTPRIEGVERLGCPMCHRGTELDLGLGVVGRDAEERDVFGSLVGADTNMKLPLDLSGKGRLGLDFGEGSSRAGGFPSTSRRTMERERDSREGKPRRTRWGGVTLISPQGHGIFSSVGGSPTRGPYNEGQPQVQAHGLEDLSDPFMFDSEASQKSKGNLGVSTGNTFPLGLRGASGVRSYQSQLATRVLDNATSPTPSGSRPARKVSRFGGIAAGELTPPLIDERARRRLFALQLGVEWDEEFAKVR
jgi:hypothetical protein